MTDALCAAVCRALHETARSPCIHAHRGFSLCLDCCLKGEVERGEERIEQKLRYLFWLN
jgi:hypothetical protein